MSDALATLKAGVSDLGLHMSPAQLDQLMAYLGLIQKWNKVYNLTAVRDPQEMLTHHLLDSLTAIAPLVRHTQGQPAKVLDVGSGGGLPGIVMAICQPELDVSCVDTVGKKAAFIQQVAASLKLPSLRLFAGLCELVAQRAGRAGGLDGHERQTSTGRDRRAAHQCESVSRGTTLGAWA
jgi:16S rRNA (guanine527-N7)-methyltransferase